MPVRNASSREDLLSDIYEKVINKQRLGYEDGMRLFESQEILTIGYLANIVRERINKNHAYYVINRHINYTNICKNRCRFCAFSRTQEKSDAFLMSIDEIRDKAAQIIEEEGASELHIVGGLHPEVGLDYYLTMIQTLHDCFPRVHLKAFTAVEIAHFTEISGTTTRETLKLLKKAGLGSLPGGGAEIFSLLYGHLENNEDRVNHLLKLRELQDETHGFLAFIPLAFHPKNTELKRLSGTQGILDIKMLAIGRLMLDNFDHVKAYWIMLGIKLSQISLNFGVDDIDGTVVEEKITHSAGAETPESLTVKQIRSLIEETGHEPVERDTLYNRINNHSRSGRGFVVSI